MFGLLIFIVSLSLTQCEVVQKPGVVESAQMMGVDTIHKEAVDSANVGATTKTMKIDKNTIITRNLKLETREKEKNSKSTPETADKEPDWSYSAVPQEVSGYVDQFKINMTECLKEVQENDKRPVKRLSPKVDSPVHGDCLIACVLKRNGVIENNKVNKDNVILLLSKFYAKDTRLMKKLEKNLDRCIEISAHHHNECDLAAKLNECTNELMTSNKHKVVVNY